MKLTLRQQIALGYLVALALMIVLGVVPYRGLSSIQETNEWVTHTYSVLERAGNLVAGLRNVEAGQRGFLLTGEEAYLDNYREGITESNDVLRDLRKLTADNPVQQARLDQLEPLVHQRLDLAASIIELRKAEGLATAAKAVTDGRGREFMQQVQALVDQFEDEERKLLVVRDKERADTSVLAHSTILYGTLGAIAVMFAAGWFISRSLAARVAAAVQQVQASAAQLQSAASEQATASTEQKAATSEASTTLKELVATSRQMAESSQRVTQIAEQTAGAARSGDTTVGRAQDAISGIKRQVDQIVGHMLELGRKSQQVGVVLDLIGELSEQTNILAINATIESAGAGESGRRFAVVADEIRKLADRVGGSTKEIRTLIEDIRSSANTTVMATEDGVKSVDAGTRQFGEVTESIRRIAESVLTTTDAAREIELGSRQQVTAVEQVSTALTGIAQASSQNEATTRQTAETAAQLVQLSASLQQLVGAAG